MKLRTIGIDLAKNVFQVCGVNEHIKPQFNKKLKRNELLDFMRQQPPTTAYDGRDGGLLFIPLLGARNGEVRA